MMQHRIVTNNQNGRTSMTLTRQWAKLLMRMLNAGNASEIRSGGGSCRIMLTCTMVNGEPVDWTIMELGPVEGNASKTP